MQLRIAAAAAVSLVLAIGCGSPTVVPSGGTLSAPPQLDRYLLPSVTAPPGLFGCTDDDFGVELTLKGDPTLQPVAWAESKNSRLLIQWPPGYSAVFGPTLQVLDPSGSVVARGGDVITSPDLKWPGLLVCIGPKDVVVYRDADLSSPVR